MIEPKTFYRDFDKLLKKIRHEETRKGFVCSILEEVRNTFGDQLHIDKMWLYEDRGEEFILINKFKDDRRALVKSIPDENEALQLVLKNGSYIYDDHAAPQAAMFTNFENNVVPAAIIIKGPEHRWLAIFELTSGWVREEVIFSLNAIRTALNYRLFSDAIKTDLEQADQIQKSLLPQMTPKFPGYEIARKYQPTEVVGGDLYDFTELEDNSFGVVVGDASGHGLPAALLVRDCVIGMRMGIEKQLKMVHTIKKLNSVIYRSLYSSRFISLFYGEIEKDGHLIYVNAGHPTQFIINGDKI